MLNDRMTFGIPGIATYKRRWLNWYADRIAQSVKDAQNAAAKPCTGLTVTQFIAPLNHGRRQGAMPDQTATLLGLGGAPVFASYAAHPVFYGPEEFHTRGDWPGAVMAAGPLVLLGAIGDVSPRAPGSTPPEKIANFRSALLSGNHPSREYRDCSLAEVDQPIFLDPMSAHPDFSKDNHVAPEISNLLVKKFAPDAASICGFRVGPVAVIGVPGEPTSHLGRQIAAFAKSIGFKAVLVVSHVNGWMGYILDAQDYARGGYEATLSFYGPQEGSRVVQAADAALKALASKR
jgi:hypothetical protein